MNTVDDVIKQLIDMALNDFIQNKKAEEFASKAAHHVAKAYADAFCHDTAPAAAFIASVCDASLKLKLSKYSANIALATTTLQNIEKNYFLPSTTEVAPESSAFSFDPIFRKIDDFSLGGEATTLYTEAQNNDAAARALKAANTTYADAYACSRAAYTHAVAFAAQYPISEKNAAFLKAITSRLTSDIKHEPIEPSFFMHIICSAPIIYTASTLLMLGLMGLTLGLSGLIFPAVEALISDLELTSMALVMAGTALTTAGSSLLACRFFTEKKWASNNHESQMAVEAINTAPH